MLMTAMRALLVGLFGSALVACAGSNAAMPEKVNVPDSPPPQAIEAVEVAKVEDLQASPEVPEPPPLPVPERPDEAADTIPLSGAWAATFGHTASFADAMKNVRTAREAWVLASKPLFESDGHLPAPQNFQKANALLDLLNRRLAAAYFAPNATNEERIAVLEEAASTLLRWSRRLDEVGLAQTPASYRTDGRLSLTFEEVSEGPAKRWRNEGYQLSKLCASRAAADSIASSAAKNCKTLLDGYSAVMSKHAPPPKSKAPAECACNPGDPLCSATMSGWCRPTK